MQELDAYMQRHRLGDAGVTHVYDLKADTSDRSRHHLEALQREATDILHSLFSASTGPSQSSSSRRPLSQLDVHRQPSMHLRADGWGSTGAQNDGGWLVIDDDLMEGPPGFGFNPAGVGQIEATQGRDMEDFMWPALPSAPG
jgi:hypothetical protein